MEYITNPILLILFLGLTTILSFFLHKLLLKYSGGFGVTDNKKSKLVRWTSNTKPAIGGPGIFMLFLVGITVGLLSLQSEILTDTRFAALVWASITGFIIGLMDDLYQITPYQKFAGQILCACILYFGGVGIEISSLAIINFGITLFWVVGIMNSINMLDNMDGISAVTIAGILISTMTVMLFTGAASLSFFMLILGVLGGIFGFMYFNWNPAKIYLGDTGTQFLGVFLAGLAMMFLWNTQAVEPNTLFNINQIVIPVVVFALPIIDTSTVFIRRIWRGQSPFVGGRDHTTHNLAIFGLADAQVASTFGLISLCSAVLVATISVCMNDWHSLCAIGGIAYFVLLFSSIQLVYFVNQRRSRLAQERA